MPKCCVYLNLFYSLLIWPSSGWNYFTSSLVYHRGFLKLNFSPCDVELLTAVIPERCRVRFRQDMSRLKRKTSCLICPIIELFLICLIIYIYIFKLCLGFCPILFFPTLNGIAELFISWLCVYSVFNSSQEVVTW